MSEMENIENENAEGHSFESGTMEGLMKAMLQNNGSILGLFDEFPTLIDNIDKGTTGTSEKGRFLSLYSAVDWSKKTKSCGNMSVKDPRLNLISYTQPFYAVNFARNNLQDGFFQRFLITVPAESFVKFEMKEEAMVQSKNVISFSTILQKIYVSCTGKGMELQLNKEAMHLYQNLHDEIVDFRMKDKFEEDKISIKSKSLAQTLRISAVICLLSRAHAQARNHTLKA